MAAMATASLAFAADQPSPRAANHDDYGRIVFDWPQPVHWTDDVTDDQVILHFDHAVAGDPSVLLKPLSKFLSNVLVSTDKQTVTLRLKMPVAVKGFNTPKSTVFDLTPKPASAKDETKSVVAKAVEAKPVEASAPKAMGPMVEVRGGKHEDFTRIVFQWPTAVGVKVDQANGGMTLHFDHPGQIKPGQLEALLPSGVSLAGISPTATGTDIALNIPPGMGEHHYADKGKVVFDLKLDPKLVAKTDAPKAEAAKMAAPVMAPPAPAAPPVAATPPAPAEPAMAESPPNPLKNRPPARHCP